MNKVSYLEALSLNTIAKYTKGHPDGGVPFTGYPRAHPLEKNKLILVSDPLGAEPAVLEFKLEDILFVEETPSAMTEAGEGVVLYKFWVKRGAVGMIIEPFEVSEQVKPAGKIKAAKDRILHNAFASIKNNQRPAKTCD